MIGRPDIEIGAVRPGETDAFLSLMCEAFGMEFEAAKPIFYADPYLAPENKIVLRLAGEIVSCLTVVDRTCWIGEAQVRLAGIAGVCTRRTFQRKGYAGMLIHETAVALSSRGYHMAALFPVDRDYYRRFGWETAGVQQIARAMAAETVGPLDTYTVRKAQEPDIPELIRLYDRASMGRALYCLRDEKRWRYLLTYLPNSVVACGADGNAVGYMLEDYRDDPGGGSGSAGGEATHSMLRILEMAGDAPGARRVLREYVRTRATPAGFEYAAPRETLLENGFVVAGEDELTVIARILDWQGLLTALSANWRDVDADLALALVDSSHESTPQVISIRSANGRVQVEPADPRVVAAERRPLVVGDIHAWSAVTVGHCSALEAHEAGLLKASSARAAELAERLFPARAPFIPPPDHF